MTIHCIAIGGTGMAPLACLLQELGHDVRGSDGPLYPPMSTLLEGCGIQPLVGFDAAHVDAGPSSLSGEDRPAPDLVIVGNAVPRHNPEAERTEELGLPRISMPQAIARFLLSGRRPLVVAGTHGKTTTTTLASWVYAQCGADPGYLIGGMPRDLPRSFHLGTGERFIVEGDEYNASYFDRGPKFLHYQPETLILTSVEYDHADLYPSHRALLDAYRKLLELVPADGLIVGYGDSSELRALVSRQPALAARVCTYGFDRSNDVHPLDGIDEGPWGSRFRLVDPQAGEVDVELQVPGRHNVLNALGVWTAARRDGLPADQVAAALAAFRGAKRRLEELGTVASGPASGITVVDDFAHHPTAVAASLSALRHRYPNRRVLALFEPRSLSAARLLFQDGYRQAFGHADVVLLAPVFHAQRLSDDQRLDVDALSAALREDGVQAETCASNDEVLARTLDLVRDGDVVVTMSSGSFDAMPRRVLEALAAC